MARTFCTFASWSVQPCVRPICAVHMTAGHNALRGSGPSQKPAFDHALAQVGCPDRRIDRHCITCCLPSQPPHGALFHTCLPRRGPETRSRRRGDARHDELAPAVSLLTDDLRLIVGEDVEQPQLIEAHSAPGTACALLQPGDRHWRKARQPLSRGWTASSRVATVYVPGTLSILP